MTNPYGFFFFLLKQVKYIAVEFLHRHVLLAYLKLPLAENNGLSPKCPTTNPIAGFRFIL